MRLLIDGNNLMPFLGINPKGDNARLKFYQHIPNLLKSGDNAIIFLDGSGHGSSPNIGNARIIFSGLKNADDEIVLFARGGDLLVTSDIELSRRASSNGAKTIKCGDFLRKRQVIGKQIHGKSEELRRHFSSKKEKKYWENVFQIDKKTKS